MSKTVSIVIPVYQNAGSLFETYRQIKELFTARLSRYDFEVVFIDDGSTDNSPNELNELRLADPKRVKLISFTRNFGQLAAQLAGFKFASGDALISLSADLQDPIDLMLDMVEAWESGSETVVCHRTKSNDSWFAVLTSKLGYKLMRIGVPTLPKGGFDYWLMDRAVADDFNSTISRNGFPQGDVLWLGYRTYYIPYERRKRTVGVSQYDFWGRLKNFLDAMIDSSYLPIRLISLLGLTTATFGFVYLITVIFSWFSGETPFNGWAPIMVALMLIGGLIMLMLGVIGEYVWRIYDELKGKPNYIIRDKHL